MANINFEKATAETLENIWVLVSRKKRTKDELYTYISKGDDATFALERMKEEDNVFVTLFPITRLMEYINPLTPFTGRNEKLFSTNLKCLEGVGYATDVESIATAFEDLINALTEEDEDGATMAKDDDWSVAYRWDDGIFDAGYVEEIEEEETESEEESEENEEDINTEEDEA